MPEDCTSLRLRLLFEYTRFLDWGDAAGLSTVNDHNRFDLTLKANRPMIFAALSEMHVRLQKLTKIKGSFEELQQLDRNVAGGDDAINLRETAIITSADLEPFEDKLASQDVLLPAKRRSKAIDLMARAWNSTKQVTMHPKRLKWAMHDKQKFEDNLRKIKELTDFLHAMLGDSKMQRLLEQSRETGLGMMQLITEIDDLKALLRAATIVPPSESDDAGSVFSQATTVVNEQYSTSMPAPLNGSTTTFEQLTRFRLQYSEIHAARKPDQFTEISFDRLQLDEQSSSAGGVDQPLSDRLTGRLQLPRDSTEPGNERHTQIWVEWKEYDEIITVASDEVTPVGGPAIATKRRVEQLAMLLKGENPPAEFCIPKCVGYCQDEVNTRFGFIYENPKGAAAPRTLRQLLSRSQVPASLRSRIKTAKDLATSLLFLHAVGWLHKDLRSDNIVFDGYATTPELPDLSLAGFGYARPDEIDVTTNRKLDLTSTAIYRHPDHQGLTPKRYRKTYDYYSLGVVLIELAFWQPADAVLAMGSRPEGQLTAQSPTAPMKTRRFREQLLHQPTYPAWRNLCAK